jgi:hypothetical protein
MRGSPVKRFKRRVIGVVVAAVLGTVGVGVGTVATATSAMADAGDTCGGSPIGTFGTADGWVVQCLDFGIFGAAWYPLYPISGGTSDGGNGKIHPPLQS